MINSILEAAYPGIAPLGTIPSKDDAEQAARDYVATRFPEAVCAFSFGSYSRNEQKWFSDLDLFVILPKFSAGKTCEMQRVIQNGLRIEAFVYTEESFHNAAQRLTRDGRFVYHAAVINGVLVSGCERTFKKLQDAARVMMNKPRPPIDPQFVSYYRTYVSSQLVKLSQVQDAFTMAHHAYNIYTTLYLGILRKEQNETFNMDILPKAFRKHDPASAEEVAAGYLKLCSTGDPGDFIRISAQLLDRLGGPAWHGVNDPYPTHMPFGARLRLRLQSKFAPKRA